MDFFINKSAGKYAHIQGASIALLGGSGLWYLVSKLTIGKTRLLHQTNEIKPIKCIFLT